MTYDSAGNPLQWKGNVLQWDRGRRLIGYGSNGYTYDSGGIRQSKTVNGITHTYYTEDGTIHKEELSDGNKLIYGYDESGIASIEYGNTRYYVQKNVQGDVVALVDGNKAVVAKYIYDAWGNHKVLDAAGTENTSDDFIGNINPIRYRGYYYDRETGLFYLTSRYYDPETGRFINADDVSYINPEIMNGLNLYAYCGNNPVMGYDPEGTWDWGTFWKGLGLILTAAVAIVLSVTTFGAGIPLAMGIVAGVTLGAGILTGVNGIATIIEAGTGYNFVRDGVFQGNDTAYGWYTGITEGIAVIGSAILGAFHMTGRYKAARYGQKFLGKGYKKVGPRRWVSADGLRQMIFDNTHHFLDGVRTTNHFNFSEHAANIFLGKSPILKKIHVFYNLFKIWLR